MKTLENKISNNKFVFYIRTWDGIDKPEYDIVASLDVPRALWLIKELQNYVEETKKRTFIEVNGSKVTLEIAKEIHNSLTKKLQEYGE